MSAPREVRPDGTTKASTPGRQTIETAETPRQAFLTLVEQVVAVSMTRDVQTVSRGVTVRELGDLFKKHRSDVRRAM